MSIFTINNTVQNINFNGNDVQKLIFNGNLVWEKTPAIDYTKEFLTFEALESGTIQFKRAQSSSFGTLYIYYSKNDGAWTRSGTNQTLCSINVVAGDKVRFYSTNQKFANNNSGQYHYFSTTCKVNMYGNFRSLLDGLDFADKYTNTNIPNYNFYKFFTYCKAVDCSNMIIDLQSLKGNQVMAYLFGGDTYNTSYATGNLEHAPYFKIQYTTGSNYILQYAFKNCQKLKDITIEIINQGGDSGTGGLRSNSTFYEAFYGCTSLETVNFLFDLNFAVYTGTSADFYRAFYGCTSLKYLKFLNRNKTNDAAFTTTSSGIFYQWMTNCPNTSACKWVRYGGLTYKSKIVPSNWTIEEEPLPS